MFILKLIIKLTMENDVDRRLLMWARIGKIPWLANDLKEDGGEN